MRGEELKAIREQLKLTQLELAEVIGVTSNTIARWERGEVPIREPMSRLIQSVYIHRKKRGTR